HNATANTVVQLVVPDALRGRVISVWSLTLIGFTPIGSYQAGLIAEHWGAPVSVALGGVVCGLTALVVLSWRWTRLRHA
ncbi:MAG TPA: MFS transporter, partial [Armatimonadota bacterium]